MDRLWAPWRQSYVRSKRPSKGCLFCKALKYKRRRKSYIVQRSKFSFSMLNIYPYNNGHMMVSPKRHIRSLTELNDEEKLDLVNLVEESCSILDKVLKPEGYNIGINSGKVAGCGVEGHLHVHIVPRWGGDTNFMPVVSNTKVIPQSLDSVYEQLNRYILRQR